MMLRGSLRIGGIVGGFALLCLGRAEAQRPRFIVGAPIVIEAGEAGPQGIAVADLNKDGRPDIVSVSADAEAGPIAVVLNQGNGVFGPPQFVSDPDGVLLYPIAVAVADVGAVSGGPDGNQDVIVIDEDGFLVLFGDGAGNFTIEGDLTEIDGLDVPVGVAVADFDGKNGPDLAIIDAEGATDHGEVHFFCNIGQAGVFEPCISAVLDSGGEDPIDVGTGDFNGDGRQDAVVLNRGADDGEGNVALFIGQGDGRFSLPPQPTFPLTDDPRDLVVGQINSADDAIDDVAVVVNELLSNDNVTILLGGTTGSVFRRRSALLELASTSIAVGRFTTDDYPDIAGGNDPADVTSIIAVAFGDGTGTFADPQNGGVLAGGALALVAAHLNDDALDDLVALSLDGSQLRIALNVFNPATHTPTPSITALATRTPTPTSTSTLIPSITPSLVPTATVQPTSPASDDDSCSIVASSETGRGSSWLPLVVCCIAIIARRAAKGWFPH